jgi:hypothetical protein
VGTLVKNLAHGVGDLCDTRHTGVPDSWAAEIPPVCQKNTRVLS